jgi:hypothetical protein
MKKVESCGAEVSLNGAASETINDKLQVNLLYIFLVD